MRRLILTFLTLAALLTSVAPVSAIPNLIPYQGRLTDAAGNPLNGAQSVVFAMYNVATAGAALYTETQSVTVVNGLFSVNIGSVTPLPATLWTQSALFLGIKVGTDAEMTPRQTMGAVAFAERAATSEDAVGFSHRRVNGFTGITATAASMASVVLNAPTAGFAYLTAGGYSFVSHTAGDGNEWWIQISPTAGTVGISAGVNAIRITDAAPQRHLHRALLGVRRLPGGGGEQHVPPERPEDQRHAESQLGSLLADGDLHPGSARHGLRAPEPDAPGTG